MACGTVLLCRAYTEAPTAHWYVRAAVARKARAVIPVRSFSMGRMAVRACDQLEVRGMAILAGLIFVATSPHFFP